MAEDITPIVDELGEFFNTYYSGKVKELSDNYPSRRSLEVAYADLEKFSPELADELVESPDSIVAAAEQALWKMPLQIVADMAFEPHVRFFGLPASTSVMVESIGAAHIGKLISVDCMVTKRSEIKPKVKVAVLRCRLCDARFKIPIDKNTTVLPETCDSCKRRALFQDEETSVYVDLQRAEAQEPLEHLRGGAPATHIEMWIEDDLVNTFYPGQRLLLTGVLRILPFSPPRGKPANKLIYSKHLEVMHIQKVEKEFEEVDIQPEDLRKINEFSRDPEIYDKIRRSIAPSIYGHDEVKEALALQLFGGTPEKHTVDGGRIRNDIHVLLIGDPGAAKTRFLQFVTRLAPKSVYVSGKSVSAAGLTAAAEKDDLAEGGWTLKAGALVLASNGIAGVDEFDKIDDADRASMHEVMESGTVSVAKAGIVATFNAKTSILAAANPKYGRFDPNMYPAQQFDILPTLLSRFDLIFPIRDVLDEEKDKRTADHILQQHMLGGQRVPAEAAGRTLIDMQPPIDLELLRKYIAYARKCVQPVLTPEASDKLKDYYVDLRKLGAQAGAVPITARYLDGLARLCEASAKTRLSQRVEAIDAQRAIALVDFVLRATMMDKATGRLDVDIIATGQPKSRVDKIRAVLDIVRKLEKEFDLVEIRQVVEEAQASGIDEDSARQIIDELLRKAGELYEPKHGFVKIVRPKTD
ncbi:MAG: minichromosome maintenance protein MCM [Candidatus ainarchaeum sp.]|nr:minichromosome maintenance protein MCM [Candidatus ainarchaeum sp.]